MNDIREVLTNLGLTDTETSMYLAMLKLGPNSVLNISREAGVSRTAAYDLIRSLQEKGLASTFQKGKKKVFTAEDPEQLDAYFKNRLHAMKGDLKVLKRLMPELRVIGSGEGRPRVRFYTGDEGVRALFRDVASSGAKELLEVVNVDTVYEQLDTTLLHELRETEEYHRIHVRGLVHGAPRKLGKNVQIRLLNEKFGEVEGSIWIYADRVAMVNLLGEVETVIVEQHIFAEMMRALFNASWQEAEPYRAPAT